MFTSQSDPIACVESGIDLLKELIVLVMPDVSFPAFRLLEQYTAYDHDEHIQAQIESYHVRLLDAYDMGGAQEVAELVLMETEDLLDLLLNDFRAGSVHWIVDLATECIKSGAQPPTLIRVISPVHPKFPDEQITEAQVVEVFTGLQFIRSRLNGGRKPEE